MATDPDSEQEAQRLKSLAETKYKNSNLKSALKHANKAHSLCPNLEGISSMLTAFKILLSASKPNATPDWYKILQVEPFSHINSIKKQYRKLALILHPDKNPFLGCEEAFKLVGEGFSIFSDKIKRKEYDMKLRIRIQEERAVGFEENNGVVGLGETFWTACSRCRLLHQFERKYLGHSLVCPSCKKSFLAVEVDGEGDDDGGGGESTEDDEDVLAAVVGGERSERKMEEKMDGSKDSDENLKEKESVEWGVGRLRTRGSRRMSSVGKIMERYVVGKVGDDEMEERLKSKRVKVAEETMTLAEMKLEMKRKVNNGRGKSDKKEKVKDEGEKEKGSERHEPEQTSLSKNEKPEASGKSSGFEIENQGPSQTSVSSGIITRSTRKRSVNFEAKTQECGKKNQNSELTKEGTSQKRVNSYIEKRRGSKSRDLEIVSVEDLDLYDFDKDRSERNFKKGQVWAIYDDDDGMPWHYALIEEVFSVNPFEAKMSWLDFHKNGDDTLISWKEIGLHVSCGRFKVSSKSFINSVNIFSHMVECERAAKEIYRIYPRKGSVWAIYNETKLGGTGRNRSARNKHCYDLVVLLTTYSESHGLSMAYLEKVDGFKTIFKRREIGCQAIRCLGKDDIRLFSHQIPARKLSGDDVPDLLKDGWELDSASLPPDLLVIDSGR